jgi:hypothetical protein
MKYIVKFVKYCARVPCACIFWGFVAVCLVIAKIAETIEDIYHWSNAK